MLQSTKKGCPIYYILKLKGSSESLYHFEIRSEGNEDCVRHNIQFTNIAICDTYKEIVIKVYL